MGSPWADAGRYLRRTADLPMLQTSMIFAQDSRTPFFPAPGPMVSLSRCFSTFRILPSPSRRGVRRVQSAVPGIPARPLSSGREALVKFAQPRLDPAVIRAAARLLEEDRGISNLRILQRLALRFGPEITRAIPVTRVERLVREPALLLLRTESVNGVARAQNESKASSAEAAPTQVKVPGAPKRTGRRNTSRKNRDRDAAVAREVEDALVNAFALGAAAETSSEIVEAFRKLDGLRKKVRIAVAK